MGNTVEANFKRARKSKIIGEDLMPLVLSSTKKPLMPCTPKIETVRFDMQKIQNPEISGIEYQQGQLLGYEVREYLL